MVNGAFNLCATSFDLALDRGDPLFQLVDRKMIDILPDEKVHRIVGPLREKIVRIHRHKVDPDGPHVNKPLAGQDVVRR